MIKTLNPYPNPAKTAEIMSRYRPIAPKPETPNSMTEGSSSLPKQSPYLRNLWPQLQARPTRTRKRGRTPFTLPSSLKRPRTHFFGFCPPYHVTSPAKNLSLQGFAPSPLPLPHPSHAHPSHGHPSHGHPSHGLPSHGHPSHGHPSHGYPSHGHPSHGLPSHGLPSHGLPSHGHPSHGHPNHGHPNHGHPNHGHPNHGHPNHGHAVGVLNRNMQTNTVISPSLVTLPLLPCSPGGPAPKLDSITTTMKPCGGGVIDLNTKLSVPEERDLLQQLQKPVSNNVIQPLPVRPIGSSITVVCIGEDTALPSVPRTPKGSRQVEKEVESEALPVVISDSKHRVRMANSAYKEMVGQPRCPWLESMVNVGAGNLPCKRISGDVALHLCDSNFPTSANGFSCWVRIEWESELKKCSVNAFCDVMKLACESRDYLFTWRFHTRAREAPKPSCTA
ncbi:hypothetical protein LR48_Vigan07g264100 [Vigna angularis]|nr:uncharacterized protein LOC108337210 [Vigna angularis]KOM48937.1 hypothetical protein LR48_Vigan07g264100 [Vigna angularis]BAT82581.1 hypothetical protein VIGAN_03262000 [Vigna angularis var. angularis]